MKLSEMYDLMYEKCADPQNCSSISDKSADGSASKKIFMTLGMYHLRRGRERIYLRSSARLIAIKIAIYNILLDAFFFFFLQEIEQS